MRRGRQQIRRGGLPPEVWRSVAHSPPRRPEPRQPSPALPRGLRLPQYFGVVLRCLRLAAGLLGRLSFSGKLFLHRIQALPHGIRSSPLAGDGLFRPVRPALGSSNAGLGARRRL